MNNSRTKQLPRIIISQTIVGLIMFVFAMFILFFAQGYRFNWKSMKVIKTGIIYVVSDPKDAQVYINGKLMEEKTPFSENLTPGKYIAEVRKDGYQPWYSGFKIEEEFVTEFKPIVLFKEDIKIEDLTDKRKIELLNSPIDTLALIKDDNNLSHNDYEIWADNNLVTRFSEPIQKVVWYPDLAHIIYQKGKEIRIIEKNGSNDTLLVTLTQGDSTIFLTNNRGDELYFSDNNQYKVAYLK